MLSSLSAGKVNVVCVGAVYGFCTIIFECNKLHLCYRTKSTREHVLILEFCFLQNVYENMLKSRNLVLSFSIHVLM